MNAYLLWIGLGEAEIDVATKWDCIRQRRNELLARCDWTQLADAPLTLEEKQAWSAYRQALRNVPQEFQLPDDVIFPDQPGA